MKPILLLLIGPPNSGKSTFSKEFAKQNKDYFRFNRDDMRLMLQNSQMLSYKDEDILTDFIDDLVLDCLLYHNKNVILDQTNCKEKYLIKWEIYKDQIEIQYKLFDEPLDILSERNCKRTSDKVPEEIIINMYNSLKKFKNKYDLQPV